MTDSIARKLNYEQKLDSIEYFVDVLHYETKSYTRHNDVYYAITSSICQAVHTIARSFEKNFSRMPSVTLMASLVSLTKQSSPEVRFLAQDTINCLLCEGFYDEITAIDSTSEVKAIQLGFNDRPKFSDSSFVQQHAKAIRESLYEHLRHLDNQANNLYSVWISMVILLYRIGIEELFKFISLTFAIQDTAQNHKFGGRLSRNMHTVVAACFSVVAQCIQSQELQDLVELVHLLQLHHLI